MGPGTLYGLGVNPGNWVHKVIPVVHSAVPITNALQVVIGTPLVRVYGGTWQYMMLDDGQ